LTADEIFELDGLDEGWLSDTFSPIQADISTPSGLVTDWDPTSCP
jgi:hypothetical protein